MYTQDQNKLIMQSSSVLSTWTSNDHTMFLNALVNGPDDIAGRWQELADAIPGKTAEEVKAYYETVERELLEIEAGRVELPHYPDNDDEDVMGDEFVVRVKKEDESVGDSDSGLLANGFGSKRREKERKKATPWTEEEHRKFLQGLEVYGKGDWRSISRIMVVTRTATQVASHAQKYFLRQASLKDDNNNEESNNNNNNNKKKKRRRSSIHDITTADGPAVVQGQPSSSAPPTASLNGGQGRGGPAVMTSSPHGGEFNGGRGRGRSSLVLWPGMQAITTNTVVVNAQPISSTPPATCFYDSSGRIVPTTPSSPYFSGGQGGGEPQPLMSYYGGQGGGAPQRLDSFCGVNEGSGVSPHPTPPPKNGYGEQGGAPLRYEFIKHLAPNHVRDYTLDEEFGFRNCYFNE